MVVLFRVNGGKKVGVVVLQNVEVFIHRFEKEGIFIEADSNECF